MPTPSFNSAISLLKVLGEDCAIDTSWYSEASIDRVLEHLSQGIDNWPSLYVIDDIDSLSDEDQSLVVDYCRDLDVKGSKFLFTTRKKISYSSDICISVGGLEWVSFKNYISRVTRDLRIQSLNKSELKRIFKTTDGSPLLSRSVLRLCKQGDKFDLAIRDWEKKKGEDARNAALSREIDSLSVQSKRVLYCISLLHICSKTELKQLSGLGDIQLSDCIEELEALFLVGEPEIIKGEPMYSISYTTRYIVREKTADLADDYQRLNREARRLRKEVTGIKIRSEKEIKVAKVISQTVAFMREGEFQSARDALNVGLGAYPDDRDLLAIEARYFLNITPPNYEKAKNSSLRAIEGGNHRPETFESLYVSQMNLNSIEGAIDACKKSIAERNAMDETANWYKRLAELLLLRSAEREGESLITDLATASEYISQAIKNSTGPRLKLCIERLKEINDKLIISLNRLGVKASVGAHELIKLIELGDSRTVIVEEARRYLNQFYNELSAEMPNSKTMSSFNLYEQRKREFINALEGILRVHSERKNLREYLEFQEFE